MIFRISAVRTRARRVQSGALSALIGAAALALYSTDGHTATKLKILHSFCKKSGCTDGTYLTSPVVRDAAGNIYGVTGDGGGRFGVGTAFEIASDGSFHTLHQFGSQQNNADGALPFGNLIIDTAGNLYGVTGAGGNNDYGTIFKLSPNADRTKWKLSTLYSFCPADCSDGAYPSGALTYQGAASGQAYDGFSPLYGTTSHGGTNKAGVVFRLSFGGAKAPKALLTPIYAFCSQANCSDGGSPNSLTIDAGGTLYGTAVAGGPNFQGVAFQLSSKFQQTVLYAFCQQQSCADGSFPRAMTLASDGTLYGTTLDGGVHGAGTVFKLVPKGANSRYSVVHSFCSLDGCADGGGPAAWPLAIASDGTLYGTTLGGGAATGDGTIFKVQGENETVLYSFCQLASCKDGTQINSSVVLDEQGNLYGTAEYNHEDGDNFSGGSVWELIP